jgi:hypothetical protein
MIRSRAVSLAIGVAALLCSTSVIASWDVFAQDFPPVRSVKAIPDDFKPKPLGTREEIIAKIVRANPTIIFDNTGLGILDTSHLSLEISVGDGPLVQSVVFHSRGGKGDPEAIARTLKQLGIRAVDSQSGEFFNLVRAKRSQREWQQYRDRITKQTQ